MKVIIIIIHNCSSNFDTGWLSCATPITAGGTQAEHSSAYNTHISNLAELPHQPLTLAMSLKKSQFHISLVGSSSMLAMLATILISVYSSHV